MAFSGTHSGTMLSRYRLLEQIGAGGTGGYRARDERLAREVAVKVILQASLSALPLDTVRNAGISDMRIIRLISIASVVIAGTIPALPQDRVERQEWEQIGTINGQPVLGLKNVAAFDFANRHKRQPTPEDQRDIATLTVRDVCKEMGQRLMEVVTKELKQQFEISVTVQEVALTTEAVLPAHGPNLDVVVWRQKWTAYNDAAHQVFDLHQDPEQVYQTLIAPLEQDQDRGRQWWEASLVSWATPEGRAQLAYIAKSSSTTQAVARDLQWTLEWQKLNDAIDSELAAGDPQFDSYLEEWRRTATNVSLFGEPGQTAGRRESSAMSKDQLDYLNAKRHQFWMTRYAAQQITFKDPNLASQCHLGSGQDAKAALP